jgi:nucleotide-binding universal stress UspA family protein
MCTAATPPEQAVPAAAALAAALGGAVEIVLLDGEGDAAEGWRQRARELLAADATVRV